MKNLAIIPARSGSKGLPDKNIRLLEGKPLLAWSIETAIASGMFGTIHVSTDSEQYAEIARRYGADVPFLRSAETSTDTATSWSVVLEVLENYSHMGKTFDTVSLLQPTSPLRTMEDIRAAFHVMEEQKATTVVSVCEMDHSPLWCNTLPENRCMDGFLDKAGYASRQKLQPYYRINGAIYLLSVKEFLKKGSLIYDQGSFAYIMPRERSVDIDEPLDFTITEEILRYATVQEDDKKL